MTCMEGIKGRIKSVSEMGLTYDQQILIALPELFDFVDNRRMVKIADLPSYVEAVIKTLSTFLTSSRLCSTNQMIMNKILPNVWPILIRRADPQKFGEHVRFLRKFLELTTEHLCILIHYSSKMPQKYPQFCIKQASQQFQIKQKIPCHQLIDIVTGQECMEALLSVTKFSIHKEMALTQQNQYDSQSNISSMTKILERMFIHRKNIFKLVQDVNSDMPLIKILDKWSRNQDVSYVLKIFRTLKIIMLSQCLFQMKIKEAQSIRSQQPIVKIIFQLLERMLHQIYSFNGILKIIVLDWVLNSKIWANSQLKEVLMYFLISCHEIHSKEPSEGYISELTLKLFKSQQILICKYLVTIKQKHFNGISFRSKVPKSFLRVSLGLIESQTGIDHEVSISRNINGTQTGTVSLNKVIPNETPPDFSEAPTLKATNLNKLISTVIKFTENLELHKIIVLCQVLRAELQAKTQEIQTDSEQKKQNQLRGSNFRRLYYYICRCIQQYEEVFGSSLLVREATKIMVTFASYFNFTMVNELYKGDLYDLDLMPNSELCLDNLGTNLLKNSVFYSLGTIFVLYSAHNNYLQGLSQNKRPSGKREEKVKNLSQLWAHPVEMNFFIDSIKQLSKIMTKKSQEVDYWNKIIEVEDKRVIRSIFLNLTYYLMARRNKSIQNQRNYKNSQAQLLSIIQNLYNHYFLKQNPNIEELNVIKILATAHKNFENWRRSARRSLAIDSKKVNDSVFYDNYEQQQKISKIYWDTVVKSSKKGLYLYAINFQRANCIKESIYFHELHNLNRFAVSHTAVDANRMFSLYQRLEEHLNVCKPYVMQNIYEEKGQKNQSISKIPVFLQNQVNNQIEWKCQLKFLSENPCLSIFSSIVFHNSTKISSLEDIQEINHSLNQIYLLSCFYEAIKGQNYSKLHQNMLKSNDKLICLSIVQCLEEKKIIAMKQAKSKHILKSICSIIYKQRLRFKDYECLLRELNKIHPENMTAQQIRAAIILYSETQDYHKVRLLFRAMKSVPDHFSYRQQLQFLNIEAGCKCMMFYPVEEILKDLETIVKYIQDEKIMDKVNANLTYPLFETFKFICESYPSLSVKEQRQIIILLNRYLKKVYSINNFQLSSQACYFILRYILIQSQNPEVLLEDASIFPFQSYRASIIQAHRPMLIISISQSEQKNLFITKILVKIAQNNPKACSWWLYGLINHCKNLQQNKIDRLDRIIESVGTQVYEKLRKKMINLEAEFAWIDWLLFADEKGQYKPIPKMMVSPFTTEITLQKVVKISPLGHGKSKPYIIEFKATKNKASIIVCLIRKLISGNKIGFRTQSAAANFFKDSKLLDESVTYSIIHLNKNCLLVQYIKHISTLDQLMMGKIESTEFIKITKLMDSSKGAKVLGPAFDDQNNRIKFQLSNFFFDDDGYNLVSKWWSRYTNFVKTYAQWCFLGYVVGLGDRHTNNILVTAQGKVIHIDFQYIFDAGMSLPYPQWVSFRFSRGLQDQLSVIEPYGLIYSEFIKTAENYRRKSRQVWLAESHFSYFKKSNISINKRASLNHKPFQESIKIFESATSPMLLRDMFIGWASYK